MGFSERNNSKLKIVSFFTGIGGMDLGALGGFKYLGKRYKKHPCEIVYAGDFDEKAIQIYNQNFKHKAVVEDVTLLDKQLLPDFDMLLGGFPCQSFSIIAQNPPRLGVKDSKGQLFFEMVDSLKIKNPRFFIAENVKGILSANEKKAFPIIISEFENAGYFVKYKLLNSFNYGVPQKRERVFIVGFKNKSDFEKFDFPKEVPQSAKKVLKDIELEKGNDERQWYFSERAVQGMLKSRHKMNKGRVQDLDSPSNTISSHLSKVSLNSTDPVLYVNGRYRRFTPREAASIQSFPEDFKLDGVPNGAQYRGIGNAVPPVLMWHVISAITDL